MSEPFVSAELTRLSQALGLIVRLDTDPAGAMTINVSAVPHAAPTFWDINERHLFNPIDATQALSWLSLLELAAAAGYLELGGWHLVDHVYHAALQVQMALVPDDPRRELLARLLARLKTDSTVSNPGASWDQTAFDAFESYLSLTRTISADQEVADALAFVHSQWRPGVDQAALLSPRHFAEALATGHVGAVETPGIQGMLRALDAYEWLVSIVARLQHRHDLRDGLLRHARWSHAAWVSRERVDEWAVACSEWSPVRDTDGEMRWSEFRKRVFGDLEHQQEALGLAKTENGHLSDWIGQELGPLGWRIEVAPAELDTWVNERVAEGRVEAARRSLAVAAEKAAAGLVSSRSPGNWEAAKSLVKFAKRIADLRALDTAAALVAPHLRLLTELAGPRDDFAAEARSLCARARAAMEPATEPQLAVADEVIDAGGSVVVEASSTPTPEPRRHRSVGGTS